VVSPCSFPYMMATAISELVVSDTAGGSGRQNRYLKGER
jgi:hypothetical protein